MAATTGIAPLVNYAGLANNAARVAALLALIPNPDVAPAKSGGGFLDEISPMAAAQLRVEITALAAALS